MEICMAEIKSTLDLIMEKTQNMTLSEEEKNSLRTEELERKALGLVQQYCNRRIPLKDIRNELNAATGEARAELAELFRHAIIDCIDLDGDNSAAFALLEEILELDTTPYVTALATYGTRRDECKDGVVAALKAELEAAGISGTAVVPNISAGEEWKTLSDSIREDFRRAVSIIADN
jgi:hypothetical protein